MTRERVKTILDRVPNWPPERQKDAAHMLELMEEQDTSGVRLNPEQLAEIRRRRAETNPKTMTLAEFNEHLHRRYGISRSLSALRWKNICMASSTGSSRTIPPRRPAWLCGFGIVSISWN
jgi:hypothetical protein